MLEELTGRWSLRTGPAFEHANVTCSWVAPVICGDGGSAVLKLAMPHMEGAQEIQGLRFWNGDPTVRLLVADDELGAMLLERCQPGDTLHSEPEDQQDVVIARLAKRLWKRPASSGPLPSLGALSPRSRTGEADGAPNDLIHFRHLSEMLEMWRRETVAQAQHWPDAGLVHEGLRVWETLAKPSPADTLLATDLHAGNVLRSEREPWLVIDPKPFVGDAAFDLVQHLQNCEARLQRDPIGIVTRLADLAEVNTDRLRLWMFSRAAADPRPDWGNLLWIDIARALAP